MNKKKEENQQEYNIGDLIKNKIKSHTENSEDNKLINEMNRCNIENYIKYLFDVDKLVWKESMSDEDISTFNDVIIDTSERFELPLYEVISCISTDYINIESILQSLNDKNFKIIKSEMIKQYHIKVK